MPLPLSEDELVAIERRVASETERASMFVGRPMASLPVCFDLSGAAAGMFCSRGERHWFRFNPWHFAQNFDLHLSDTVTHEVAHYAVAVRYPRRRVKPHGAEWQSLMRAMGAEPKATFSADTQGIPIRRQRRHPYRCECRDHDVSTTRHNRILSGRAEYRCTYCHGVLRPVV